MQDLKVNIDGKEYNVKVEELDSGKLKVHFNGETFDVETKDDIQELFKLLLTALMSLTSINGLFTGMNFFTNFLV